MFNTKMAKDLITKNGCDVVFLIDYLKNDKWCAEGVAIDALKDYLNNFCDMNELFRVADFYGFSRETLTEEQTACLFDKNNR